MINKDKYEFPDQSSLGYLNLSEYGFLFLENIYNNPQATSEDEIPGATGKFGFSSSNPIPIHGVPNSKIYLNKLRLYDGTPITYERKGSTSDFSIKSMIDKYSIYNQEGKEIAIIYISPYHLKCSEKVPEGFILDNMKT